MKLILSNAMRSNRRAFSNDSRRLVRAFYIAALVLLAAVSVPAHPGHGLAEANATHLVTSPYHLSVMAACTAALGLLLTIAARLVQTPRTRRLLQIGAGSAAVLAVTLWMW